MKKLMSHLVANYPDTETAFLVAQSLVKGGAHILEIQLPFSDPSADGPAIQNACSKVLEKGITTQDGLDFISRVHNAFPQVKIALMSYGSLIFTPGVENFCKNASAAGVNYMIIPDLPFDHDEGLSAACKKFGMENVPVAAPSMTNERFSKMIDCVKKNGFKTIYAVLRTGITGSDTKVDEKTIAFLKRFRTEECCAQNKNEKIEVYGGFGVSGKSQVEAMENYVDGVVAGSVFVRLIDEFSSDKKLMQEKIISKARELVEC